MTRKADTGYPTGISIARRRFVTSSFFNPIHSILDGCVYIFDLGMFLEEIVQPIVILAEPLQFLISQTIQLGKYQALRCLRLRLIRQLLLIISVDVMRVQVRRDVPIRGVARGSGVMRCIVPRTWDVRRVVRRAAIRLRVRDVRVTGSGVVIIINARVRTGGRQMWKLRVVIRIERRRRNIDGILLKGVRRRVPSL